MGIRTRINLPFREWIEVEKKRPGVFTVVDDSMTDDSMTMESDTAERANLGFSSWDEEVEDLDNGWSDESQCFGISSHLRWREVDLTPKEFRTPSIKRLKEALSHVTLVTWCPREI